MFALVWLFVFVFVVFCLFVLRISSKHVTEIIPHKILKLDFGKNPFFFFNPCRLFSANIVKGQNFYSVENTQADFLS